MIKYLAVIFMLLDHINKILFNNEYLILTIIGRLAFPLFIYLAVSSYMFYTSSKENYILRILFFALLTTPFYTLGFGELLPLNIFYTISLGLVLIYMIEQKYYLFSFVPYALSLYTDYSFYGVLCFLAFYYYLLKRDTPGLIFLGIALFLLNPYYLNSYLFLFVPLIYMDMNYKVNFKSFLNKYVFYAFYPLHIAFLGFLR